MGIGGGILDGASIWTGVVLLVFGGLVAAHGAVALVAAGRYRAVVLGFPRAKWVGWVLAAVDVAWCCGIVMHASLGRFSVLQPWMPVAGVGLFLAVVFFMDELLAARAFGGLLLLIAQPVLMAVRWAGTRWHLLVAVLMYACVVWGAALLLHPWLFRVCAAPQIKTGGRIWFLGAVRAAVGLVLAGIGAAVLW